MTRKRRPKRRLKGKAVLFFLMLLLLVGAAVCLICGWIFMELGTDAERTITTVISNSENSYGTSETISSSKPPVEAVTAEAKTLSLEVGESTVVSVSVEPKTVENPKLVYSSDNEAVASVDQTGEIVGIAPGTAKISVTAEDNEAATAQITVTVCEKEGGSKPESGNTSSNEGSAELTYIDGILIVNKTYALPEDYAPGVDPTAKAAFDEMAADAAEEGLNLYISSGYRSYEYQAGLYDRYVARDGQEVADTYSARPGHSEHQTGLAFDLNTISMDFAETAEGIWVTEHCHEYGFIIRYPSGKEDVTGYQYEPWHIRYLGVETATAVWESGLCLEEYLNITSVYAEE